MATAVTWARRDAIRRNQRGKKTRCEINRKPSQLRKPSASGRYKAKKAEHKPVRAKVEQVFGVVKGLFKFRKTRYRGLPKQVAKLNTLFALANLYLADKRCLSA